MTDRALHAHFTWAGGSHRFALPMRDHMGLAFQHHGVNDPFPRLRRLLTDAWTVDDVVGTIKGGLIGGKAFKAHDTALTLLMSDHVLSRPLADNLPLAKAILLVALFGVPAEMADSPVDASEVADAATGDHLKALEDVGG